MFAALLGVGLRRRFSGKVQVHRNPGYHRRLVCEPLEDRRLLSVMPQMLGDLTPGAESTEAREFTQVGDTVFFSVWQENTDLWKTDGTPDGTVKVATITHANLSPYAGIGGLLNVDGTLAIIVYDHQGTGTEADDRVQLWKSGGTAGTTVLVHDFGPGAVVDPWGHTTYCAVDDRLFGAVRTGAGTGGDTGYELWVSDLTTGASLVKDINPGTAGSDPYGMIAFNDKLYFAADDGTNGVELWVSDGSPTGTVMVKNIQTLPGLGSYPTGLTFAGDGFFFGVYMMGGPSYDPYAHDSNSIQLWKSDGTPGGTVFVHDFGLGSSAPGVFGNPELTWFEETAMLFGVVEVDDGPDVRSRDLFAHNILDGTTGRVANLNLGGNDFVMNLSPGAGGWLGFIANDGTHGVEPWVTNGMAENTYMVKDIHPGAESGVTGPAWWTPAAPFLNGAWYFQASDGVHGWELWKSDGTEEGTVLVADIWPGDDGSWPNSSQPFELTAALGKLFFAATTEEYGEEPWVLDPAAENLPPVIASLTADPAFRTSSQEITLTTVGVGDPDGHVVQVEFYRDANGNGVWEEDHDEWLGSVDGSEGWSWTGLAWGRGEQTFFARAQDDQGAWSAPVSATAEVVWPDEVAWFNDGFSGEIKGVAINSEGVVWVVGGTWAADEFIAALSGDGEVLWTMDVAGVAHLRGIAVDADDNILVVGLGEDDDAFVAKFAADGSVLLWSASLGGATGAESGWGIAVDAAGNVYVVGRSESSEAWGHGTDAYWYLAEGVEGTPDNHVFVAKLSSAGILQWTAHLGGDGYDAGAGIAIDPLGNPLIVGTTGSPNFPMAEGELLGEEDGFAAKLSAEGELLWSTYLGGSSDIDWAEGIAVDAAGNALVTGITCSSDFVAALNEPMDEEEWFSEAFVTKVAPDGTVLWTAYLGSSLSPAFRENYAYDGGLGIAVDVHGNAVATGFAHSDIFVAVVSPDGVPLWSTCLSSNEAFGNAIALDGAGNAIVGGLEYWYGHHGFVAKVLLPATAPPISDLIGRVPASGDWWMAASNGTDGFANERVSRWSANVTWLDVMAADFTGNGFDDIVGRVESSGDWWLAVNHGDGTFTNQRWGRWSPNVAWTDVMVGDFTGDGKADIVGRVGGEDGNGDWWVAESNGSGFTNRRWGRWSPNVAWEHVLLGDFTGDGKADLVGRVGSNGDWWVAESTGAGFTNARWGRWSANVEWLDVMTGDFNDDGQTDIVGRVAHSGDWWVAKSNDAGTGFTNERWGRWSPDVAWEHVLVGDFTGDGRSDLVGRVGSNGDWWVAESTGTEFANARWGRWSTNVDWLDVMAGDFNGDGRADLIGRVAANGDWWVAKANTARSGFTNERWGRWSPTVAWEHVMVGNFAPAAAALHAAYAPDAAADLPSPVSQVDLAPIIEEAVLRFSADLENLAFQVHLVDLPGLMLGRTVGNTIQIDPDAAGFGWYVNPTDADFQPANHPGERTARPGTDAVHRIDLLTAVLHEMGHLLGHDHAAHGLMQPTLGSGLRRLPAGDAAVNSGAQAQLDDEAIKPALLDDYFALLG